jgi:hypothetical protein
MVDNAAPVANTMSENIVPGGYVHGCLFSILSQILADFRQWEFAEAWKKRAQQNLPTTSVNCCGLLPLKEHGERGNEKSTRFLANPFIAEPSVTRRYTFSFEAKHPTRILCKRVQN